VDTETVTRDRGDVTDLIWRCGAATFFTVNANGECASRDTSMFTDPALLWQAVHDARNRNGRTMVWMHNSAFDMRVSLALDYMVALGYTISSPYVADGTVGVLFKKGRSSFQIVDFTSWVNRPLHEIGDMVGTPKKQMPQPDAAAVDWAEYCAGDTHVLADAVLQVIQFIAANDLGNLANSASGQAWNAFRHRLMPIPPIIHWDQGQRQRDRDSGWCGRNEVWRHGRSPKGGAFEYDMKRAYLTVARECELPWRLSMEIPHPKPGRLVKVPRRLTYMAEVRVETDKPLVPASVDGHPTWPVGTFTTMLWEPEIRLLIEEGQSVTPLRLWYYNRGPVLRDFATYVEGMLDSVNGDCPAIMAPIFKHWTRSLIGRFSMRSPRWGHEYREDEYNVSVTPTHHVQEGWSGKVLQLGHDVWLSTGMQETENSFPAITSYIMSECRVRLWRLMATAGLEHVLYVDTDSVITDAAGAANLSRAIFEGRAYGLQYKGGVGAATFHAPRCLEWGDRPRMSGVKRDAITDNGRRWTMQTFDRFASSRRDTARDGVTVRQRTVTVRPVDRRRRHLPRGKTEAIVVSL